jgi:hypothetical protein
MVLSMTIRFGRPPDVTWPQFPCNCGLLSAAESGEDHRSRGLHQKFGHRFRSPEVPRGGILAGNAGSVSCAFQSRVDLPAPESVRTFWTVARDPVSKARPCPVAGLREDADVFGPGSPSPRGRSLSDVWQSNNGGLQ